MAPQSALDDGRAVLPPAGLLISGISTQVSQAGVEPARPGGHQFLKLARMPFRH